MSKIAAFTKFMTNCILAAGVICLALFVGAGVTLRSETLMKDINVKIEEEMQKSVTTPTPVWKIWKAGDRQIERRCIQEEMVEKRFQVERAKLDVIDRYILDIFHTGQFEIVPATQQ